MVKITKKAQKPKTNKQSPATKKRIQDNRDLDRHQLMVKTLKDKYGYDYVNNTGMPKDELEQIEIRKIIQRVSGRMTLKEFKKRIDGYFDYIKTKSTNIVSSTTGKVTKISDRKAMSIHGLCNHLGITINTYKQYMNKEGLEDYHETAQLAHQKITATLVEGSLEGKFNPTFSKWYLKNTTELDDTKKELSEKIEQINFLTVKDRDEILQLQEDKIIDVEVIDDDAS